MKTIIAAIVLLAAIVRANVVLLRTVEVSEPNKTTVRIVVSDDGKTKFYTATSFSNAVPEAMIETLKQKAGVK